MSKVVPGHPGEERLLRFADGELPPRQSAEVRAHLEACWECRAELDTLQTAVAECIHYRKSVLQAHLPPPPSAPWPDLTARFRAIDEQLAGESSWLRTFWDALSAPKFWVPAVALGLVMTLVVAPWLQVTPTVQAAELLRKAVAAAEVKPRTRALQVRTRTKRILRTASTAAASAADLRPVAALFESAGYDWADPLSAKAYLDWNSRLAAKTDDVVPEGNSFYDVRTRSTEGEMTEATLRLRQGDLQPVQGTFKFRNDEWVELTEVPAAEPGATPIAAVAAPARVNPTTPAPEALPSASPAAAELRVLEALHRIGADLGDPLEISRSSSGAQIAVKGFGIDPRRGAQIEQALRGLPNVAVDFASEGAPAGIAPPSTGHLAVKSKASPLEPLLEQRLGNRAAIEQFTNELLDRDEQIMARAHAIERLAARFPNPALLAPPDLSSYRALQRNHAQALLQLQREFARVLQPVVSTMTAAPSGKPATPASLLQAARQLEVSLSSLLGAASFSGDAAALPERIGAELAALEQLTRAFLEGMGQ